MHSFVVDGHNWSNSEKNWLQCASCQGTHSTCISNRAFLLITVAIPINSAYQCIMHVGHVLLLMQVASPYRECRNVLMPKSEWCKMAGAERADIIVQLSSISAVFLNVTKFYTCTQSRSTDCIMYMRGRRALAFAVKVFWQHVGKCVQVQHTFEGGGQKLAMIGIASRIDQLECWTIQWQIQG